MLDVDPSGLGRALDTDAVVGDDGSGLTISPLQEMAGVTTIEPVPQVLAAKIGVDVSRAAHACFMIER